MSQPHQRDRAASGRSSSRVRCGIAAGFAAAVLCFAAAGFARAQDIAAAAIGPVARAQIAALLAEKEARTPAQQKIDSRLLLTIDARRPLARFPVLHSLARPLPEADGRLIVDIDLFDGDAVAEVVAVLEQAGAEIVSTSARFRAIRARVDPRELEAVAAAPNVRFIQSRQEFDTNKNTTSEGDVTHRADLARSTYGYTGAGQKVCAISDGVDSLAGRQATGDLPAVVDILPGQAGSGDEGAAMLEIIHDLAPGARLGYATAVGGLAAFAQNVLDLADPAKGACGIIVDDISYSVESPFQDGAVAQAVNTVTAAGVAYFSSAANSGNLDSGNSGVWEGTFNAPGALTSGLIPGHVLHEFAAGVTQNVALDTAPHVALHWADPAGASTTDYDLYVLNATGTAILASSTNTQNGTQNPFEYTGASGTYPAGSRVIIAKKNGEPDRMFWMNWYRGELTHGTAGATKGHSAASNAFSVAATPVNAPGPYPGTFSGTDMVETFSSDGPRRIFFDFAGNLLPGAPAGNFTSSGGVERLKPDITAADGVATSTSGFNPFFGTSAAAPHAAAIAALLKQAFPAWTLAQLRTALTTSAIDIQGPGWDRNSGAGIVMPQAALLANAAPPIAGLLVSAAAPAEVNGNGNGLLDAGEDWKFDITLANIGGVAGSGIVATLVSNTSGVVVTSPPVSYPAIAVNASAANPAGTPFRFSAFNLPCGQDIRFTLSVVTAQSAAPQAFELLLPAALGAPLTFSYTGPSVAIPDGIGANQAGATATVNLPVAGVPAAIGDVDLRIDGLAACTPNNAANAGIDHAYVGDLVVGLRAPDATLVNAIDRINRGGTQGPNLCNATLDDQSAGPALGAATSAAAPFAGSWTAASPLAAFRGLGANGTWQLRATDFYDLLTGHINRFSVIIRPFACAPASRTVTMTAAKSVTGTFAPGGAVVYIVTLTNTGNGVQADNPGDEYVDVLPGQLTLTPGATWAGKGTLTTSGNTVRWNGALNVGESVVLTIAATVKPGAAGLTVTSQGTAAYDANHDGANDTNLLTDDAGAGGAADPTVFAVSGVPANLDVDGNGSYDALTDGLMLLRYLFNLTGPPLVSSALGEGAQRIDAPVVLAYLTSIRALLDVDDDGTPDALTDGLLILRYLFGLRGAALINNAVTPGAPRSLEPDIVLYLQGLTP
ncbi:MAG: S8 family serine peptidase [Betaproteobacteria bacterium]|nr:S8 family serine peptidase [Betaproteobacteria bacterium]